MPDIDIARLVDRFMRRIHASLNAKASEFDRHRIGPNGGIILLTLAEIEPARIQELVRRMSRDKSQMTRGVQALESKGLIERRAFPDDARVCLLALTPEGRATVGCVGAGGRGGGGRPPRPFVRARAADAEGAVE